MLAKWTTILENTWFGIFSIFMKCYLASTRHCLSWQLYLSIASCSTWQALVSLGSDHASSVPSQHRQAWVLRGARATALGAPDAAFETKSAFLVSCAAGQRWGSIVEERFISTLVLLQVRVSEIASAREPGGALCTTYDNNRHNKTMTPYLVLWCQPNSKFLKIAKLYKIIKSGKLLFG